ncbi:MAG: cytochrome c, partial [Phycisphaerae bacterium]|nr:cytochrome c [Phycisphaerae bacterium]
TLDHIIAYLRSVKVRNPVQISVDPTKKYHGDASAGKLKYTQFCGSCHGPRGEGYLAGGSGPGIGLAGFLQVASDDYIYQTVKHGRVGTPMRSFIGARGLANLSPSDVGDIITHLRSLN